MDKSSFTKFSSGKWPSSNWQIPAQYKCPHAENNTDISKYIYSVCLVLLTTQSALAKSVLFSYFVKCFILYTWSTLFTFQCWTILNHQLTSHACLWTAGGSWKTEWTCRHRACRLTSWSSNQEPFSCEMTVLNTSPLRHLCMDCRFVNPK